ncbi:MAG TPA: CHAT domain-containing protein [Thermoanaerobaculia bacterium]|jgi:tetratricopeptide (TPR) repeat protein|nr:CHAT domain-containing protein [Thermoanaerobaculia bacterium]
MKSPSQHLDPETLAAFAEGKLDAANRDEVIAHLDQCEECLNDVALVMPSAGAESEKRRFLRPAWIIAIAAVVVLAVALPALRQAIHPKSPTDTLVALVPRSARLVEPRLTGGFPWAGYHGPMRATGSTADAQQLKLGGAAGELIENADHDQSAEAQHAAGIAMVLVEKPDEAIAKLETAARVSKDAKSWSDLAAARYATASKLGRASLYPEALAAADAALRIDPNLPEALFNRALILERLGLTDEAKRAWQRYLETDSSSDWATEARSRIAQLPATTHASQFEHDRPLLERAAERGDTASVRRYVDAHRELARRYADYTYLDNWAEALQRNDMSNAARWLTIARHIGDALVALSGEALLRDAIRVVDAATPAQQREIAAAQILYFTGRTAYSRGQRDAAVRDLLRAAEGFEAAHDPMALQARYYAAGARSAGNDAASARADLEGVLAAANAHPEYISLGGQVRWELGRAMSNDDNWLQAVTVLTEGTSMFRRCGERASEAFTETILAYAYRALDRDDDAWLARLQSFAALSAEGESERLATSIAAATYAELAVGHRDAALSLSALESAIARGGARPQLAIKPLVNLALLQSMSGDTVGALQTAREAEGLARAVVDPELRANWSAQTDVATGAALAESSPRAAIEPLTRAIDFYTARGLFAGLPQPLLLRSRCSVRNGDATAAMLDLERGMTIVESHPAPVPSASAGAGVLDAEHALFTDAIRLSLERGDKASAFAFAERSHGTPTTISEVQSRLAGTGTAVIEIVSLPSELVTFAVAENDVVVVRHATAAGTIASLVAESLSESRTTAAAKLYEELIHPVDAVLDRAREVVIIADHELSTVPFAALYDSAHQRFLVERFAVSTASSAGSLQPDEPRTAAPVLAAIALPSGGTESPALPETEIEVRDVAGLYAHVSTISPANATLAQLRIAARGANIVHIAGHTERQPGGGEQALLFIGASGTTERVSWKAIVSSPAVNRGVVVLAACETLRPPPSVATRGLSLGAAFSAAGASEVIGTLTPIGDRDARPLFGALHRQLALGARPADALRAVLQDAINLEKTNGGRRAWRALALLTRRIPAPPHRKECCRG